MTTTLLLTSVGIVLEIRDSFISLLPKKKPEENKVAFVTTAAYGESKNPTWMEKEEAKEVYRLRKCTVEPVIGHIKQNLGFREFLLRGLEKVKIELNLISIAHNVAKIWKMKQGIGC